MKGSEQGEKANARMFLTEPEPLDSCVAVSACELGELYLAIGCVGTTPEFLHMP